MLKELEKVSTPICTSLGPMSYLDVTSFTNSSIVLKSPAPTLPDLSSKNTMSALPPQPASSNVHLILMVVLITVVMMAMMMMEVMVRIMAEVMKAMMVELMMRMMVEVMKRMMVEVMMATMMLMVAMIIMMVVILKLIVPHFQICPVMLSTLQPQRFYGDDDGGGADAVSIQFFQTFYCKMY